MQPKVSFKTISQHVRNILLNELTGDNIYTLPNLHDYILSCSHSVVLQLPHVDFTMVYDRSMKPDVFQLTKVCKRIEHLLTSYMFKGKMTYYLVPFQQPRKFPVAEKLGPVHINGAYTYRHNNTVYIYRYEEFPKVALHEACHNLPMHIEAWDDDSLMSLYKTLHIKSTGCPKNCTTRILPNEAIIETWANVHHLLSLSREYCVPFKLLMQIEIEHGLIQTKKLLQYQANKYPSWEEGTHAYSYVVLRTVLLYFFKELLHFKMPYDSKQLTRFMLDKFTSNVFQEAVRNQRIPEKDKHHLRMTRFGDF